MIRDWPSDQRLARTPRPSEPAGTCLPVHILSFAISAWSTLHPDYTSLNPSMALQLPIRHPSLCVLVHTVPHPHLWHDWPHPQ